MLFNKFKVFIMFPILIIYSTSNVAFGLEKYECRSELSLSGKNPQCLVYAASPYGFTRSTKSFIKEYREAITNAGCHVCDPWRDSLTKKLNTKEIKLIDLGQINTADIESSDWVVAALDGPDVDSGTAAEIGYASGRGKWIIGYREDERKTGEKGEVQVNLQVQYFIQKNGGKIVNKLVDITREICKKRKLNIIEIKNSAKKTMVFCLHPQN